MWICEKHDGEKITNPGIIVGCNDQIDGRAISVMMASGAAWYAFVLRRRPGGWTPRLGT